MFNLLHQFMNWRTSQNILVYNEFSLQFELGCFLRASGYTVRFERNVSYYSPNGNNPFTKHEIDIVAFDGNDEKNADKVAIELKFPRNGQYPMQMFSFIKDIKFMEEVKNSIPGFKETYVLCLVDDSNYYTYIQNQRVIYNYFRDPNGNGFINLPGSNPINKPTGTTNQQITLSKSYNSQWLQPTANWLDPLSVRNKPLNLNDYRYYIIQV